MDSWMMFFLWSMAVSFCLINLAVRRVAKALERLVELAEEAKPKAE